jgi:methylthioribose-1-phosphate isomerase
MRVDGKPYRTVWLDADGWSVWIIDQVLLPHAFKLRRLTKMEEVAQAIFAMQVRGAPLIGVAAAYGLCLAMREDPSDQGLSRAGATLSAARPTAVNLRWAVEQVQRALMPLPPSGRASAAYGLAAQLAEQDVEVCRRIGEHGLGLLRARHEQLGCPAVLNVQTHCNAGWLATVDFGTALSPIYQAHDAGLPLHVWVDETRPRRQGLLTAWELGQHGVPRTLSADGAAAHHLQRGRVDVCIVGTDRTTARGDVCNKIGTYPLALAARAHQVPFYVALPGSTYDGSLQDGVREIPIEERDGNEVRQAQGLLPSGELATISLAPESLPVANPAFDVTPAELVTGYITEHGVLTRAELGRLGGGGP